MNAQVHRLRPPELLDGRYVLGEVIGRGGFADVLSAVHAHTGQRVAIKRWRLSCGHPDDEARWRREVRAQASLEHPAIVRVTDAGLDERARPYVVMELLEGETLRARLERGALSVPEVLSVFEPLLDGLSLAHRSGIIHRDLKPENVFLVRGPERGVKLLDFGLALPFTQSRVRLTAEGLAVGTLDYMAPEQLAAVRQVGPPADVWALGVMIYEALAGRRPFQGDSVRQLAARASLGSFPPLRAARPDVPEVLDAIVARCLRVAAEDRFADAGVLRDAWVASRAARPVWQVAPDEPPTTPWRRPASSAVQIPATRPSQRVVPVPEMLGSPADEPRAGHRSPLRRWLWIAAAGLAGLALALFFGRDGLIVPLVTGNLQDVGQYWVLDGFWTPAVNVAAASSALASVALGLAALKP